MFQKEVYAQQAFGIVGESAYDGPRRAQPAILNTTNPANNVIGRACTVVSGATGSPDTSADPKPLIAQAGGAGTFAGILAVPKNYVSYGTATGGSLAPTMTVPNGIAVELALMDEIVVAAPAGTNPGDIAFFDDVTGELSFAPAGTAAPGGKTLVPNASITRFSNAGVSLAVLKLTN